MTLDEAIRHAEEVADYDCYNDEQRRCADEHRQLAEWLRELKRLRETATNTDTISRQAAIEVTDAIWTVTGDKNVAKVWQQLKDLPSAEPEPIRINLNEPIKVKLTDWGKEIYFHQYDRTNQTAGREICKPKFPKEDENGYTEFQLWCFMELYGEHMGMIMPNVIEPLEIVYEG